MLWDYSGKGSFGEVFKGYSKQTQRPVAIKSEWSLLGLTVTIVDTSAPMEVIDLEAAEDEIEDIQVSQQKSQCAALRSVALNRHGSLPQSEISILSSLDSPFVTAYEGSWLRGTQLWIVMEYLSGGSCGDLLKPGVFKEEYIAIVLRELLRGLEYLHDEGKLHRDIKGGHSGEARGRSLHS